MRLRMLIAACLALAVTPALAQSVADYMIRPALIRQVSPHVRIIPDESRPAVPNVGFVLGSKALLVVDTGLGPRNGAIVAAEARRLAGSKPIYLVATHAHPEHDIGAQAFPKGTILIRSDDQERDTASEDRILAVFRARNAAMAELLQGATFRHADRRFAGEERIDLGGVAVRLLAMGTNHTPGDTAAFVEGDNVLFSGDVAMRNPPSAVTPGARIGDWVASLDRLAALKPAVIVPSHGPTGDAAIIADYRTLFEGVRAAVAPLKAAGRSEAAVIAEVAPRFAARWGEERVAGIIRLAYANG